jgi:hypothetical protein
MIIALEKDICCMPFFVSITSSSTIRIINIFVIQIDILMEFYEEAYFYNRRLTLTFKRMETRYR